ncbi:hypothetical protein BLOT_008684 [Blomia tropicalis]|nr:hypothetical protein BLOT_008684 [Blomia tropicalis]
MEMIAVGIARYATSCTACFNFFQNKMSINKLNKNDEMVLLLIGNVNLATVKQKTKRFFLITFVYMLVLKNEANVWRQTSHQATIDFEMSRATMKKKAHGQWQIFRGRCQTSMGGDVRNGHPPQQLKD